ERFAPAPALEGDAGRVLDARDRRDAGLRELGDGDVEVLDLEADMVDARTALAQELGDAAVLAARAEQLEREAGDLERLVAKALVGDVLDRLELGAQHAREERARGVEVTDGNGDTLDLLDLHVRYSSLTPCGS